MSFNLFNQTIKNAYPQGLPSYKEDEVKVTELPIYFNTNIQDVLDAPVWGLDIETSPLWYKDDQGNLVAKTDDDVIQDFVQAHKSKGKKVTKTTFNSAATHLKKLRKESALDPFLNRIELVQINTGQSIYVFRERKLISTVLRAYKNKYIVAHNAKFEVKTIFTKYGVYPKGAYCTMIAQQAYNSATSPSQQARADYGSTVECHTGVKLTKDQGGSDWSQELTQEQIDYAVDDVKYLFAIKAAQEKEVSQGILNLENKLLIEICKIELHGIPINTEGLLGMANAEEAKLPGLLAVLGTLNSNSPKQVKEYLHGLGHMVESTDKQTLMKLVHVPLVKEILGIKDAKKSIKTLRDYAERSEDGILTTNFNQNRAKTGRFSSSKPNVQQIPRKAKSIFYDSKHYVLLGADYPAIEMRLAAKIMDEKVMIQAFKENKDLHTFTAAFINDVTEEEVTKPMRQAAKAVNFGLLYGMGAKTLREYAYNNFGLEWTSSHAEEIRNKWFTLYPGIKRFHNYNSARLRKESKFVNYTLGGRAAMVDRFTNANNTRVQGSGADMLKQAILNFATIRELAGYTGDDMHIISIIHDELICQTTLEHKEVAGKILCQAMNSACNSMLPEFETLVELEEK